MGKGYTMSTILTKVEKKSKIVIVGNEDNLQNLEVLRALLHMEGYIVNMAWTSTQAFELIDNLNEPALVITEGEVKDTKGNLVIGFQLHKQLFERARQSIMTLTYIDNPTPEFQIAANNAGIDAHLTTLSKGNNPILLLSQIGQKERSLKKRIDEPLNDGLTGLINRLNAERQLRKGMQRARRADYNIICAFIDVNKFKFVNDSFGHHVGDKLLQAVATELKAHFRRTADLVCRWGGDEIMVIMYAVAKNKSKERALQVSLEISDLMKNILVETGDINVPFIGVNVAIGTAILGSRKIKAVLQKAETEALNCEEEERKKIIDHAWINLQNGFVKIADKRMYQNKKLEKER
jgi:diguanylate cyclase (GGDEF)-like protein